MANILVNNIILATVSTENTQFCRVWFSYVVYSAFPIHFSIGAIQILRIHAMYNRDKRLLIVMCTLFALDLGVGTVIIGLVAHRFQPVVLPPGFTGCIPTDIASYAWVYWLPMLIMEILLFALSALKSIESMQSGMKLPFLLSVLFRDSVLQFAGVTGSVLVNFAVWIIARQQLFTTFFPIALALHSIIGCRMLMNIHMAIRPYTTSATQRPLLSGYSTRPTSPGPGSRAESSHFYLKPMKSPASGRAGFPPDVQDPRDSSVTNVVSFSASGPGASSISNV